nr:thiamine phosphate synthase [Actibacterium ureilyticum]
MVTDPAARGGVVQTALAAARAGAGVVQLRDKHASDDAMIAQARALKAGLDPLGVPLIVNDRIAVAQAVGAAGVHVGQGDDSAARARAVLGPGAIVGLSVETDAQLAAVDWGTVDYIGASPVYATPTKPDHAAPLGLDGLARLCAGARGPVVAIGGLGVDNAAAIRRAGAAGVAVVSAICGAEDPGAATRRLLQAWEDA